MGAFIKVLVRILIRPPVEGHTSEAQDFARAFLIVAGLITYEDTVSARILGCTAAAVHEGVTIAVVPVSAFGTQRMC